MPRVLAWRPGLAAWSSAAPGAADPGWGAPGASPGAARRSEGGQIVVLFAIMLVALCGVLGLVIDLGSTYAQRRAEQAVVDLSALAGATAWLNAPGDATAKQAAADTASHAVAAANGHAHGVDGVTVVVQVTDLGFAGTVRVVLNRPHRNAFSGVLGLPSWDVTVAATALSSGRPNAAAGAMPLLFNAEAFPNAVCDERTTSCVPETYQEPGVGNEDVPQDATQFNWTIFCTASGSPCNANSDGVRAIVNGDGTDTVIDLGMDIGPLNAGAHTTLFDALSGYVGGIFPVPIVNDAGDMVGFAYFRLTGIEGNSQKVIKGYFVSPVNADRLIVKAGSPNATVATGSFVIKLID